MPEAANAHQSRPPDSPPNERSDQSRMPEDQARDAETLSPEEKQELGEEVSRTEDA